jgi:hypothetical protein
MNLPDTWTSLKSAVNLDKLGSLEVRDRLKRVENTQ